MARIRIIVFVLAWTVFISCSLARAQDTTKDFEQAMAEYQQSPTYATAEKVIKMALAMAKLPVIPEEARKHFVRGAALFKEAKTPDDFSQVIDEFRQAAQLAPWWAEAQYNQALACEAAGKYTGAIENLKLYQLFKLPDTEARAVQDKIYVLEAKQEKAAKESNPEAVAAQERKKSEDWLKKLDGARFASNNLSATSLSILGTARAVIDIQGDEAIVREMLIRFDDQETARLNPRYHPGEWMENGRARIVSEQFTLQKNGLPLVCTISKDGNKITCAGRNPDGSQYSYDYYRSMER